MMSRTNRSLSSLALLLSTFTPTFAADDLAFRKHVINLDSEFMAAAVYDVNKDGKLDIACGEFWYEAPTWKKHFIRKVEVSGNPPRPDGYAHQNFDVNGDGWTDIVTINWRTQSVRWIEHPGAEWAQAEAQQKEWATHIIATPGSMETGRLADILGDGTPTIYVSTVPWWYELVRTPKAGGGFEVEWKSYRLPQEYAGHGAGLGDINGDGRADLIGQNGWLEAPVDRRNGQWIWHADFILDRASVPILVIDVDQDGLNDLVYSMGHDYGVYWMQQSKSADGKMQWTRHAIDTSWAGSHAPLWVDLDKDGKKELVVGRRYLAHGSIGQGAVDPGEADPQAIYRYDYDSKTKTWTRFTVSYNDGTCFGLDPVAIDLTGSGRLDLVFGGRHGLYWFENLGKGSGVGQKLTGDAAWFPQYADHKNLTMAKDASGKDLGVDTPEGAFFTPGQRRAHTLAAMQAVMGTLPDSSQRVPLDVKVLSETQMGNAKVKKITYASDPTSRVNAYLLIPNGAAAGTKAALVLHDDSPVGKEEPMGGGREGMGYAKELVEKGYVCLVPDYPTMGEDKYDLAANAKRYPSGALKAVWDNIRGLDLLESLPEVGVVRQPAGRIAAVGHGVGAQNALLTAAFDYRISVVIASGGFTTFDRFEPNLWKKYTTDPRRMPRLQSVYGGDPAKIPFDFPEVLAAIAPRPIYINAPLKDPSLDSAGVKAAVDAVSAVYQLKGAQGAVTLVQPDAGPGFSDRQAAYTWLDQRFTTGARGARGRGARGPATAPGQ